MARYLRGLTLHPAWCHYLFALCAPVVALYITAQLGPALQESLFFLPLLAAGMSAVIGGLGPGLLATGIGAIFAPLLFWPAPSYQELWSWPHLVRLAQFLIAAGAISWGVGGIRRAEQQAVQGLEREREAHRRALAAEQRFLGLVQGLDAIVWEAEVNPLRFTFVSNQTETILGYPAHCWLDDPDFWVEHIHPGDRKSAVEFCAIATTEGQDHQFEYRMLAADGRVIWMRDLVRIVRDDSGKVLQLRGVLIDITEQKLAERRLAESEQRLKSLFDHNPDMVYAFDPTGNFLLANPACSHILGYAHEELLRMSWKQLAPPEDLEKGLLASRQALSGEATTYQLTLICKDGRRLCVSGTSFPMVMDKKVVGTFGIARDVTRQREEEVERERLLRQEQAALAQAEDARRRLSLLSEASSLLASSLDFETTLEQVVQLTVPQWVDWCVVDMGSETGVWRRIALAYADPNQEEVAASLRRLPPVLSPNDPRMESMRTGHTQWSERVDLSVLAGPSGELSPLFGLLQPGSYICVPLCVRGRVLGTLTWLFTTGRVYRGDDVGLAEELARRVAMAIDNASLFRELQQADQNKDQFLALLGHELRNPLGPIRNSVEIIKRVGVADPRQQRALDIVERQVGHEARLIDDLLNVTRIARGRMLLHFEHLDLVQLVQMAAEDHRSSVEAAGLKLQVDLPDEAIWVRGDPTRLAQVIGNLIHNSTKFTDPGGQITVRVRPEDTHGAQVSVQDTGIGIPPMMIPQLFEPFAQVLQRQDRSPGGLGLGLVLVKRLVEMHGGEVQAYSAGCGEGSEFTITLPREVAQLRDTSTVQPEPELPRRTVLVVEDNPDAAESIQDLLEMLGHEVQVAYSGPEALEVIRDFRPQVVLCDIGLPGMDGYEVARALRRNPVTANACLIAVTGYGQAEDRRRAEEAGFDYHLVKPVDLERLQVLIEAETSTRSLRSSPGTVFVDLDSTAD